jgi:D-alanyl-D-alanine carboxypeptidase/D-alanyl-D-alanine-endopeptidase (penicillin-binding protein 4)
LKRALPFVTLVIALVLSAAPAEAAPRKRALKPLKASVTLPTSKKLTSKESAKEKKESVSKSTSKRRTRSKTTARTAKDKKKGAARVAFSLAGEMRPTREVVGRREEPLTLEEDIAKQIEKLLRGPLRRGITGLYVADARTGAPLFSVNADAPLNPASNVKMISMAAALELLGPTFRYSTRVLGREVDTAGTIKGDMYLLGTWDPTLEASDMDDLAKQIAARGVKRIDGDVVVGSDPTRDGIYRSMVPIEIVAGDPGKPPTVNTPMNFDLVVVDASKAKTDKKARKRHRLKFATETIKDAAGHKRIKLTIKGTIGKTRTTTYRLYTRERTAMAAHSLLAALRANNVVINGDVRSVELGDFIGDSVGTAGLPIELARHDSNSLAEIIRRVNKRSINWLADRVIMTAAALAHRTTPSMPVALEAMYDWLQRHPQLDKDTVTVDTGSGLSYRTRITPIEIVKVVRCAAGFSPDSDPALAKAWHDSLSIAGTDGTLRHRFRSKVSDLRGHLRGKTGSLSTVIALSGLLELDPSRPLAFSIVTNTPSPLKKGFIRKAHEQLVTLLARYVTATANPTSLPAGTPVKIGVPASAPLPELDEKAPTLPEEIAEPQLDPELDSEAVGQEPGKKLEGEPAGPVSTPDDD